MSRFTREYGVWAIVFFGCVCGAFCRYPENAHAFLREIFFAANFLLSAATVYLLVRQYPAGVALLQTVQKCGAYWLRVFGISFVAYYLLGLVVLILMNPDSGYLVSPLSWASLSVLHLVGAILKTLREPETI